MGKGGGGRKVDKGVITGRKAGKAWEGGRGQVWESDWSRGNTKVMWKRGKEDVVQENGKEEGWNRTHSVKEGVAVGDKPKDICMTEWKDWEESGKRERVIIYL